MIQFYFDTGPNPIKVALFLEEAGLTYEPLPIDTRRGEQFSKSFLLINPNGKLPAIVDGNTRVFDSNAILLYLADKHQLFLPACEDPARAEVLSWLMFIATGVGPYGGQALHFRNIAPEPKDYALARYMFEAKRHFGILDAHLSSNTYLAGGEYGIADMAFWGWARLMPAMFGEDADTLFPSCARHRDVISARQAAQRAAALRETHQWKLEFDDEAKRNLFPHQIES